LLAVFHGFKLPHSVLVNSLCKAVNTIEVVVVVCVNNQNSLIQFGVTFELKVIAILIHFFTQMELTRDHFRSTMFQDIRPIQGRWKRVENYAVTFTEASPETRSPMAHHHASGLAAPSRCGRTFREIGGTSRRTTGWKSGGSMGLRAGGIC
jgi:hypothetical protein